MATVLHLLKSPATTLARTVIDQHVRAGDRVSVSYTELLDLIFESDHVITW